MIERNERAGRVFRPAAGDGEEPPPTRNETPTFFLSVMNRDRFRRGCVV